MTTTEQRPRAASDDLRLRGTHAASVVAGPHFLADHDAQDDRVGEDPNSATIDHPTSDSQIPSVGGDGLNLRNGHSGGDIHAPSAVAEPELATGEPSPSDLAPVRVSTSPAPRSLATPRGDPVPGISNVHIDHAACGSQGISVDVDISCPPEPATGAATATEPPLVLVDDTLAVLANQVGDLENFRKACGNQLSALTRTGPDKDGNLRGWGLPVDHPAAIQQATVVAGVKALEDQAIKALEKHLKRSPLGPWVLAQKGLGFKTIARLLAATGDPYWNSLHDRPRTVAELRSYCGYGDATTQRKVKGQRVGWSPEARMRGYVCSSGVKQGLRKPCYSLKDTDGKHIGGVHVDGCTCSPYRVLYDETKARYIGSVHPVECQRCTGKGKTPAPAGSPRKAAHIDAIAIRAVTKQLLKNLWHEAQRLHEPLDGQSRSAIQGTGAVGAPTLASGHGSGDAQRKCVAGEA